MKAGVELESANPCTAFQAIGFDAFGTLIDYPVRLNPYRRFLNRNVSDGHGTVADLRRAILTSNQTPSQLACSLEFEGDIGAMMDELSREAAAMRLYPDVRAVLEQLRRRGFVIGVCSNLAQAYGDVVRTLLGDSVDALVFSFEVGTIKPDRKIFDLLCGALRVEPGAIAFIGDSVPSDVDGAEKAGILARQIRREKGETLSDVLANVLVAW